jgi:tol-pal system protein YbgF
LSSQESAGFPASPAGQTSSPELSEPETPATTILPSGEEEGYRYAFNLLKGGQHNESIAAFNSFLAQYPKSPHADNAQYWLGEAYYVKRQFEPAIAEYEKLVENYPRSQKLTHALLKIGYSYQELGRIEEAKDSYQNLKSRYPGTTAARLAEERLQRLTME